MSDNSRGAFTPVHGVLPNPSEPDWIEPIDLDVDQNEAATAEDLPEKYGSPVVAEFTSALQTIDRILSQNIESINRRGADLFKESNYAEAQKKAEQGKALSYLKLKFDDLSKDWMVICKDVFSGSEVRNEEIQSGPRKRKAAQKLLVNFYDGSQIFESSAAETFSKSIARMGISRVEGLGIKRLNHPLVSVSPPDKYQSNLVDGYYIVTHFSTEDKRRLLLEIGERLGVSIQADLVD